MKWAEKRLRRMSPFGGDNGRGNDDNNRGGVRYPPGQGYGRGSSAGGGK